MTKAIAPSSTLAIREAFERHGGGTVARCYQCATCSSVCELAPANGPFPRRQMQLAQWGMVDQLARDPSIWLCYQCNDCTTRCPRDARPGDVMQTLRRTVTEHLAFPRSIGRLVANAGSTWWLLLGAPIAFWVALVYGYTGLHVPELSAAAGRLVYEEFVPHILIYSVFFTVTAFILITAGVGATRYWGWLGEGQKRQGSFLGNLVPVLIEVMTHRRFSQCDQGGGRRWPHFWLFWGFVGAAVTSGFIILYMYVEGKPLPVPQGHPYKILGNLSAISLVVGVVWLLANRTDKDRTGNATSFDNFFLYVVLLLVATGLLTELGAFYFDPMLACYLYLLHLGTVLCLFVTFPFSKFAHLIYRILALVHARMAAPA